MALANAVQGARHTAQQITWKDADGAVVDLTGATITARIRAKALKTISFTSDGVFTLVAAGANGVFTWKYSANDIATAGKYEVQFKAAYTDYDLTLTTDWEVLEAI